MIACQGRAPSFYQPAQVLAYAYAFAPNRTPLTIGIGLEYQSLTPNAEDLCDGWSSPNDEERGGFAALVSITYGEVVREWSRAKSKRTHFHGSEDRVFASL
jgi:hypothetical protein